MQNRCQLPAIFFPSTKMSFFVPSSLLPTDVLLTLSQRHVLSLTKQRNLVDVGRAIIQASQLLFMLLKTSWIWFHTNFFSFYQSLLPLYPIPLFSKNIIPPISFLLLLCLNLTTD